MSAGLQQDPSKLPQPTATPEPERIMVISATNAQAWPAQPTGWMDRGTAENDPRYRQIIPYVILFNVHTNSILMYRRGKEAERRLDGKVSIGWGGHVTFPETIQQCIQRELFEELGLNQFSEIYTPIERIGKIILSEAPVDRVHLGDVWLIPIMSTSDAWPDSVDMEKVNLVCAQWVSPIDLVTEFGPLIENWSNESLTLLANWSARHNRMVTAHWPDRFIPLGYADYRPEPGELRRV